jgi:hypothetical protein
MDVEGLTVTLMILISCSSVQLLPLCIFHLAMGCEHLDVPFVVDVLVIRAAEDADMWAPLAQKDVIAKGRAFGIWAASRCNESRVPSEEQPQVYFSGVLDVNKKMSGEMVLYDPLR